MTQQKQGWSPVRRKQGIGIQTEHTGSGHMEGIEDEIRI